jgi:hypothetical protein
MASLQAEAWHVSPLQTPLVQSPPSWQPPPASHGAQEPPQSMPVSSPFCVASPHVAADATQLPASQISPAGQTPFGLSALHSVTRT